MQITMLSLVKQRERDLLCIIRRRDVKFMDCC